MLQVLVLLRSYPSYHKQVHHAWLDDTWSTALGGIIAPRITSSRYGCASNATTEWRLEELSWIFPVQFDVVIGWFDFSFEAFERFLSVSFLPLLKIETDQVLYMCMYVCIYYHFVNKIEKFRTHSWGIVICGAL